MAAVLSGPYHGAVHGAGCVRRLDCLVQVLENGEVAVEGGPEHGAGRAWRLDRLVQELENGEVTVGGGAVHEIVVLPRLVRGEGLVRLDCLVQVLENGEAAVEGGPVCRGSR